MVLQKQALRSTLYSSLLVKKNNEKNKYFVCRLGARRLLKIARNLPSSRAARARMLAKHRVQVTCARADTN